MSDLHHDHGHGGHDHGHAVHAHRSTAEQRLFANMIRGGLIGVGVLAIVAVGVSTYGLYNLKWDNGFTAAIVQVLPYPAATVNGHVVRYSEYHDDLATVQRFFAKQQANSDGAAPAMPSEADIKKGVLDRLIQTEILREEAKRFNVSVSPEDVDAEFAKVAAAGDDAAKQIQEMYGWSVDQFKKKVMVPYLMQVKLGEALSKDESISGDAKKRAEEALSKVQAGGDFSELAKEYSQDPGSGAQGGDLGWFGKGVMVPEFETAAFALEKGGTSGLIETQFGWHIIRVEDVKKGEDGSISEVSARHILIMRPSVDQYLKKKMDEAKISRYAGV